MADALGELLALLDDRCEKIIFVGDYINRGPKSRQVLDVLCDLFDSGRAVGVVGNHETELLRYLDGGGAGQFLAMGGLATVRSYLDDLEGDVLLRFREAVPAKHVAFLRALPTTIEVEDLVISHKPLSQSLRKGRTNIFGHFVQREIGGLRRGGSLGIDTGCGTVVDGRLTALLWPEGCVLQIAAEHR